MKGLGGVYGVLREVEKIEKRADGTDKGKRGGIIREFQVDNKPKEDATHVSVLFSCDP